MIVGCSLFYYLLLVIRINALIVKIVFQAQVLSVFFTLVGELGRLLYEQNYSLELPAKTSDLIADL